MVCPKCGSRMYSDLTITVEGNAALWHCLRCGNLWDKLIKMNRENPPPPPERRGRKPIAFVELEARGKIKNGSRKRRRRR